MNNDYFVLQNAITRKKTQTMGFKTKEFGVPRSVLVYFDRGWYCFYAT